MKLYVEINGEKHYINESVVKENALHEGMTTPFTGLKIKKDGNAKTVTTKSNETITALPTAIDDSEINTDINEIADSEDPTDVVEPIPESATVSDESSADAKEPNEVPPKAEDAADPIHISEDKDYQESSTTAVNESVTKKKIPRKSKLDPYLQFMKELLEKYPDITDVRVFEELCEAGFDGGKTIVTDRLRQIRRRETDPPG